MNKEVTSFAFSLPLFLREGMKFNISLLTYLITFIFKVFITYWLYFFIKNVFFNKSLLEHNNICSTFYT